MPVLMGDELSSFFPCHLHKIYRKSLRGGDARQHQSRERELVVLTSMVFDIGVNVYMFDSESMTELRVILLYNLLPRCEECGETELLALCQQGAHRHGRCSTVLCGCFAASL